MKTKNNQKNEKMELIPKENKVYLAYIRKSTQWTKKQRMSIYEQHSEANAIIVRKGIDKARVIFYEESRSAFSDGKMRPKMEAMMKMINECAKQWKEVYIITFDPSRLSRNRKIDPFFIDGVRPKNITEKPKIQAIYMQAEDWTKETSRQTMIASFNSAELYSEALSEKAILRNHSFLEAGRWRHSRTPLGFKNIAQTEWILEADENIMPHIIEAFKMKAKNINNQEICDYLGMWGIKKRPDRLVGIFQNTVYVWYHTDKLGEVYELQYKWWKAPVNEKLFQEVQNVIKGTKRWKKYKPARERDIFEIVWRTDEWLFLTREVKVKKSGLEFVYYRNTKRKWYNISKVSLINAYSKYYAEFIVRIWNIIRMKKIWELRWNYEKMRIEIGYSDKEMEAIKKWVQDSLKSYQSVISINQLTYQVTELNLRDFAIWWYNDLMEDAIEFEKNLSSEIQELQIQKEKFEKLQSASREEISRAFLDFELKLIEEYVQGLEKEKLFANPNLPNMNEFWMICGKIGLSAEMNCENVAKLMELTQMNDWRSYMTPEMAKMQNGRIFRQIFENFNEDFGDLEGKEVLRLLKNAIREINPEWEQMQRIKTESIQKLETQIQGKKLALKNAKIELMRKWFTADEVAEYIRVENEDISKLEQEKLNISTDDDFSRFLKEIPNVLYKMLELARNTDANAENKDIIENLAQFIKYTGSNYILGKEKSLKIGINPVLELLFFNDENQWWTCRGSNPGPSP